MSLEQKHAKIITALRAFQDEAEKTTPPAGQEEEFEKAVMIIAGAEICIRNAPCFGGGGSACPPICP